MTVEKFREQATQLRGQGRRGGGPYPDAMRRWAVSYARSAGVGVNRAADRLGISNVTLRSWMRALSPSGGVLRAVVITPDTQAEHPRAAGSSPPALTLRTAQGHELGPLNLDTAVALLRALA